jgi:DNA helicase-2/ATP-dependent DNA helicase PcrA
VYEYEPEATDDLAWQETSLANVRRYFGLSKDANEPQSASRVSAVGLRPGNRVKHPKYGYGTVLRREGQGESTKLTVSFTGVGLKKLVEKYASLERV